MAFRKLTGIVHGTRNAYGYHRCRCEACRAAHAEYMRPYQREWIRKRRAEAKVTRVAP